MKLARLGKRAASAALLMVMSGAFWACSGDDNMGGAGGSAGLGGTSGTGGKGGGGTADSGKEAGPDGTAGSAGDARPDGSGGSTGTGGSGGVDSSMGGSAGDASVDRDAVAEASPDARDGAPDQGTPVTEAGDAPRGNDAPVGPEPQPEPQPEAAPPVDANDGGTIADASDGNTGQVTSDASSDHTACTVPAGWTTYFSFNTDAENWSLSSTNPTINGLGPGPGTTVTWSGDDGCPSTGQLRFTLPIDIPADAAEQIQGAQFTVELPQLDWTGRTALHVKVKVETQGGLEWLNPFIQFNDQGFWEAERGSTTFTAANLGVNVWRDIVVPLPAADAGQLVAGGMGIQIFAITNGLVQVTIDSISVE